MADTPTFQLCSSCSEIPFDRVFSGERDRKLEHWGPVYRDEWNETCSLCSYLLKCLSAGIQSHCPGQRIVTRLKFASLYWGIPGIKNLVLDVSSQADSLPIFSPGQILCVTHELQKIAGKPEVVSPLLSYAKIIDWMNQTILDPTSQNELTKQPRMTVPLMVVDCATRHLVLLPVKEPYVTVSYVWGSDKTKPESKENGSKLESGENGPKPLPSQLPSTIEDCITVCLGLNFRYLWVDRYCIYGNEEMRAQQIKEMDKVYSESALTILVCAGVDPTYGLPGVSRPRTLYPSLEFKDLGYIWAIPGIGDIKNSMWATRGWTFQEAMLSKRQLYFTDKQLFFGLHKEIKSESARWVENRIMDMMITEQYQLGRLSTYRCIELYSERHLTYPEDVLNAFLGILSRLQKDRDILHLWGIPFRGDERMTTEFVVPDGMLFAKNLCWHPFKPTRREGFPTWSWTSNVGKVYWTNIPSTWSEPLDPEFAPQFEVELMSGELCSLSKFQLRYDELNDYSKVPFLKDRPSKFIHVEAFVSTVINIKTDGESATIGVKSTTGEPIFVESRINTSSAPISPRSALIIHLIHGICVSDNHALLVSNTGSHWERVGAIMDSYRELECAKKVRKTLRLG